jgi:signal transduction histidine kinase
LPPVLPLKDSARARIQELVRVLEPHFPEITTAWRARMFEELDLDGRAMAALERLNLGTGLGICCKTDFSQFADNLRYYGTRLAKLNVDTRVVARALELYQSLCEPYLAPLSPMARAEAISALETFNSTTFVSIAGTYFDTQRNASAALLSALEAELSAENLSSLLGRVLEISKQTFDATVGVLLLREPGSDSLRPAATAGLDEPIDPEFLIPLGRGFTGRVAQTGEPAMLPDLDHSDGLLNPLMRQKAKALWAVPLKIEQEVIGVLAIGFPRPYEWLPSERELLRAIADRSALAIERARITDALREREARIAELSAHLLRAQEEERKRISRELHDATGQQLMVIRLYLGMLTSGAVSDEVRTKVGETVNVVDQTIEGIRRIIARLSPLVLQELGLVAAIRKEAKDLGKRSGVRTRVAIPDSVGRFAPEVETTIYRVVQEALHNIAKHAKAKSASVQMSRVDDMVQLVIQDDGVGFGNHKPVVGRNFGLAGMRERIGMLGGSVQVVSGKNKGTRIEITIPVTSEGATPLDPPRTAKRPFLVRKVAAGVLSQS